MATCQAGPVPGQATIAQTGEPAAGRYSPLRMALGYLGGTYLLFLVLGRAVDAPDLLLVTLFIVATLGALTAGYLLNLRYKRVEVPLGREQRCPTTLIFFAATYYLAFGLVLLSLGGQSSFESVLDAITHPGDSYFQRIRPATAETSSLITQFFSLTAALYAVLIPLVVLWWRKLGTALRLYVIAGLAVYATYFLSIGTLKGLGDMLIFWGASYVAVRSARRGQGPRSRRFRRGLMLAAAVAVLFIGYMSFNQYERLEHVGTTSMFAPNPVVAKVVGNDLATGLSVTAFYPTQGYLGLAYNLQTPFEWTYGLSAARAVSENYEELVGDDWPAERRYTARTERLTGWPDGMYWSTIYPWLASDLSYPGAVLFMGMVGWFLAKFWREARQGRTLSLVLLAQLALLLAFVPANNQIGQQNFSLIGFCSIAILSALDRINRRSGAVATAGQTALSTKARIGPAHTR